MGNLTCGKGDVWIGSPPNCYIVNCTTPKNIPNGNIEGVASKVPALFKFELSVHELLISENITS